MSWPIRVWVDARGKIHRGRNTDQAGTGAVERTWQGEPVVWAGMWYPSQMSYEPYRRAVAKAQQKAIELSRQ